MILMDHRTQLFRRYSMYTGHRVQNSASLEEPEGTLMVASPRSRAGLCYNWMFSSQLLSPRHVRSSNYRRRGVGGGGGGRACHRQHRPGAPGDQGHLINGIPRPDNSEIIGLRGTKLDCHYYCSGQSQWMGHDICECQQ